MTTTTKSAAVLAARVLLAFMFIVAGWSKFADLPGAMAYTASGGIPGFLAVPAAALELFGGIAVLVGWQTRWAGLALAAFAVVTGVLFHYVPALGLEGYDRLGQIINFQKNLTIAGGLLLLAVTGPGSLSLDERNPRAAALA